MGKTKKKMTLARRYRRWKRRMIKRHAWAESLLPILEGLLGFLCVLAVAAVILWMVMPHNTNDTPREIQPTATPTLAPTAVPEQPTATPEPIDVESTPTIAPTDSEPTQEVVLDATLEPTPTPGLIAGVSEPYYFQSAAPGAEYSDPAQNQLTISQTYVETTAVEEYQRENEIHMGSSTLYSDVEGIVTFRGSNYRDGGSYGTIPNNPTSLKIAWTKSIGGLDKWDGVGWTGQASAVRWSDELRQMMNINAEKKAKDGLVEVIYGTLDGKIYFLDLDDGTSTRDPINIGASIKGSVSVDPRGYPLLYCGQGIYEVHGETVKCATRIWSLIDQSKLWEIDGKDSLALRKWRAFDSSPLVDAATDTLIQVGENGVVYTLDLNTKFENGQISIAPETVRYVYKQSLEGQLGSENSPVVYNNYIYFANNTGIIQCVDLNTMELIWSFNGLDDIDASMVLEVEEDGEVALYVSNEYDNRGTRGPCQMFRLNALIGELVWSHEVEIYRSEAVEGGSFATPAVGKGTLSDLVFFHPALTKGNVGTLFALDKKTGETVWEYSLGAYGWSSPTCVYSEDGTGYVIVCSESGIMRLFDGLTGRVVTAVDLGANIEGSPIVFDDMIVVGTRGRKIYGIRIAG